MFNNRFGGGVKGGLICSICGLCAAYTPTVAQLNLVA
jgi:hypothetical protein